MYVGIIVQSGDCTVDIFVQLAFCIVSITSQRGRLVHELDKLIGAEIVAYSVANPFKLEDREDAPITATLYVPTTLKLLDTPSEAIQYSVFDGCGASVDMESPRLLDREALLPIDDTDDALNPKGAERAADVDNAPTILEDKPKGADKLVLKDAVLVRDEFNPRFATTSLPVAGVPIQLLDSPRGEDTTLLKEPTAVMVDDNPKGLVMLEELEIAPITEDDTPKGLAISNEYPLLLVCVDDKPKDALTLTDITPLVSSDVVEKGADENALNPSIT